MFTANALMVVANANPMYRGVFANSANVTVFLAKREEHAWTMAPVFVRQGELECKLCLLYKVSD